MRNAVILGALLICFQSFSQRKPKIKGNKSVVEVSERLDAFNAIVLNDDLTINLQKSNEEGYRLNLDDNLIDVLKFKVEDSTLFISSFYKITSKKKLDITVNYYELSSISMRDGRIKMTDAVSTDVLNIKTTGSAKLQLNANVYTANIEMEGNSSGDLNIETDKIKVDLKDRVDVRLYAVSKLYTTTMDGTATANVEGTTGALSANLFNKSNLRARKLQASEVEVIAEGSSSARVFASDIFELTSSGSAKTYLSGDAEIDIIEFLDTSQLHKEK